MGLFEEILQSATNDVSTAINKRHSIDVKQATAVQHLNESYDKLLANPAAIDSRVASMAQEFSPTVAKPKYSKYGTKTEAVDANIPTDHPLYGVADKLKSAYQEELVASANTGKSHFEIEKAAKARVLTPDVVEGIYKYKAKADSSASNLFGLFGEDKSLAKPKNYDAWKQSVIDERKKDPSKTHETSAAGAFAIGAGAELLIGGAAMALGLASAPVSVPVLLGGALVAGAVAIPTMKAGDALATAFDKSQFSTFHEGDTQHKIVGGTVGAATLAMQGARGGAKVAAGMGLIGGGIGAYSPAEGVGLGGWVAAEAALAKAGTMGLQKALAADMLNDATKNALSINPTAANLIKVHSAEKAHKAAYAEVTLADSENALKDVLAKAEGANAAKIDSTLRTDTHPGMDDDAIATVQNINQSMKLMGDDAWMNYAYPAGAKGIESGKAVKQKLTPEQKIAAKAVSVQNAKDAAALNDFLGEQAKAIPDEYRATLAMVHSGINDPWAATAAFDRLSWDGINKVIGENASSKWKSLSIGQRSIIVDAEESAKVRGVLTSTANSAERLNTLSSPLVRAVKELETTPIERVGTLLEKSVVDTANAYGPKGKFDAHLLQQDLSEYGFTSLQEYALAKTRQLLPKNGNELSKIGKSKFAESIGATWNNVGKWAVPIGLTTAGVAAMSNDAEAGVITSLADVGTKEGGKIWGNFMQSFGRNATDELLAKSGAPVKQQMAEMYNLVSTFKGALPKAIIAGGAFIAGLGAIPSMSQGDKEMHGKTVGDEIDKFSMTAAVGKVLDLLGPSSADASTLSAVTKIVGNASVSEASAAVLKRTTNGALLDTIEKAATDGFIIKEVPAGAMSARDIRLKYLNTAPQDEAQMKAIIAATSNPVPGMGLTTPQGSATMLLNNVNVGDQTVGNLAAQLAHGQVVVSQNVRQSDQVLKNIYANYGIELTKRNSDDIATAMLPAQKAYEDVALPLRTYEVALNHQKDAIAKLEKDIAGDPNLTTSFKDLLDSKKAGLAELEQKVADLQPEFARQQATLGKIQEQVARKYPEARLSLAAEDTVDFQKYPWLKGILTENERQATLQIKDLMLEYKERVVATMGKESVLTTEYMKHSRAVTAEQKARLSDLQAKLESLGLNGEEIIPLTKLHERTKYSQQMVPDIGRNMADYLPDVEKRMMNADFWKMGKVGGWDAVRKSSVVQNSPALKSMFDRIAESAKPVEDTMLRRLSTGYATLESIRLLTLLPSAPFKHLIKLTSDMATLGVVNTLASVHTGAAIMARNYVRQAAESLSRNGLLGKDVASKLFSKSKLQDEFVSGMINQKGMMDYLTDIERTYGDRGGPVRKLIDGMSDFAGAGIKFVESFDRSITVVAAARMAAKKGLTGQQAMYAINETILKNNFLSGQLNANWAKDPNVRALFLFQNTPFKIWERRIANAIVSGRDLKTAWGTIKAQDLPKEYAELTGIGRFVKQAEQSFKAGMIEDALTASKDAFGNPVSGQFVKEAIITGAGVLGTGAAGLGMAGHFLHMPFVKTDKSDINLSTSPIVSAGVKTMAKVKPAGDDNWDPDESHFPVTTFFKHWYGTSGYSLVMSKAKRIDQNDIPDIYQNSKWKFLFGVPGKEH